jgi:isopentenyl-diphosphate delta-isomerase type 1
VSVTPQELVVLVDETGQPIGESPKAHVHGPNTPLHLAFSVHIFDHLGRVLVTRRALSKRTWPGVWTNTCCGHPVPGESITDAVRRRLYFELGLDAPDLRCVLPDFAYKAIDASGVVENEICPVYTSRVEDPVVTANPDEVMDAKWVLWDDLAQAVRLTPFAFSPWAVSQVGLLDRGHNGPQ